MRERLMELAKAKRQISVNFPAAAGGKLYSISGTIAEVGDDFMIMQDIYGNTMMLPFTSISYIEIKK